MDDAQVVPLDADRWSDLVTLFGPDRGAYGRCWCMFWRISGREFDALGGRGRRAALRDRAAQAPPAGLLAYGGGTTPVGWIAVAPRGEFGRLNRSPLLKPVDDTPVWAVTCFYIARDHRRTGIAGRLIDGAIDLAATHRATTLEAYPLDTGTGETTDSAVYTGTLGMFVNAGFVEITRRHHRPIMRLQLPR